jgi:histidinol-phosphate aminotransferase
MPASSPLPNPLIAAMSAYTPGEQPQGEGWVKLNTNENPYPPSAQVVQALQEAVGVKSANFRLYPSPDSAPVREAVSHLHGLPASQVVVGNGSDDILNLLIRAYAGPGRAVGMLDPSYSLYPVLAAAQGAPLVKVPLQADGSWSAEAIAQSGATIFFLTNPNAPLGFVFAASQVALLAERFAGLLVVDEAYADFAGVDCVALVKSHPNVVVTRTLSKAYALAGLRVGYALCPVGVAEILHRVRDSYNLDRLAQVAAVAALQDKTWLKATVGKVCATRSLVGQRLQALGWKVNPAAGNFIFAEPRSRTREPSLATAADAFEFLRARKILVRRFPHHPLTATGLRISVGTEAEMQAFLAAAEAWSQG